MQINEIIGTQPEEAVLSKAEKDAELGRTDFLRMLVAQLENQDPLNPQDGTAFTAQLAQFSSLEQLVAMRSSMDDLAATLTDTGAAGSAATEDLIAAGLIGREVLAEGSAFTLKGDPGEGGRLVFDAERHSLPELSFDLAGITSTTALRIRNADGALISGRDLALGPQDPGTVEVPAELLAAHLDGQPAGNYTFEVIAELGSGASAQEVGSTPYTRGLVTGTSLVGSAPMLMVGGVLIPLADVLEIRERASQPTGEATAEAREYSGDADGDDFARWRATGGAG